MSRRLRPKPEFALQQRVEQMWEEFDYPEQDIPPTPFELSGGGGAPTVVVASSDALDIEKEKADFICSGANDQDTIQAANDLIASGTNAPGRILLAGLTFNLSAGFTLTFNVTLEGMGRAVTLDSTQTTGSVITIGNQGRVRHLTISGANASPNANNVTGIDGTNASNCIVDDVTFISHGVGINGIEGSIITNCTTQFLWSDFVWVEDASGVMIVNNGTATNGVGTGGISIQDGSRVHIADNFIGAWIFRRSAVTDGRIDSVTIANNTWAIPFGSVQNLIDVEDIEGLHITGNNWHQASAFDPMQVVGCPGVVIEGNQATEIDGGIYVEGSDRATIRGNSLGASEAGFQTIGEHGIEIVDCSGCQITDNLINQPGQDTNDTYDGIILSGTSDLNFVSGNTVLGSASSPQPRYAYNDTTSGCNRIVGNNGDGQYATGNVNAGPNTIIDWPDDPTDGDNIFECDTSPSSPTSP